MFLERLILKNVKCFKSLEVSFNDEESEEEDIRKKTVLIGINGTGKSTVLKSIALVTSGSSSLGELIGDPKKWVRYGAASAIISATLVTAKNEGREISITIKKDDTLSKLMTRNQKSLSAIDDAIYHTDRNYLTIGYGVSRRTGDNLFRRKSSNYDNDRAENVATLFSSDAYLFPLDSWLMETAYFEGESSLEMISSSLNKLLPNIKFSRIDKEKRSLLFKTPEGEIDYSELSDGYKITANWFGDLLYRIVQTYEDYKSPLKARFLLLIDEIGLHLHPSWQRKIILALSELFENAQIIATTHSPFVAQQCEKGELFTIIRDKNSNKQELSLYNFNGNPSELLINQIVMSDIFGMETDESVYVENLKTKYKELKNKKSRSKTEFENVVSKLNEIPINADENKSQQLFSDEYQQLMDKMKKML